MASEAQQGSETFKQNTKNLFAAIEFHADKRGIPLHQAIEQIGLSSEAEEALREGEPISQADSTEIFNWISGERFNPENKDNKSFDDLHPDSQIAIVHLLGGAGATEARGFVS